VKLYIFTFIKIQYLHNYFNLVEILIKHLMEKECGAMVGYSLEVHSSYEKTLRFFPIVVV
jgi:hypothetical protein